MGAREIGYLFGQYKRLQNEFTGTLTGTGLNWGGSLIRPEATGYGAVYFAEEMLKTRRESLAGKTCAVSGSGNVAQYTIEKLLQRGARPVTLSDSEGAIHDPDGLNAEKLAWVLELKNHRRGRIKEYAPRFGARYFPGQRPWDIPCDCAFPCATENEISGADARTLLNHGCLVSEGANMPSAPRAIDLFSKPASSTARQAANAGGVASGLEMTQNAMRLAGAAKSGQRLRIMVDIHHLCPRPPSCSHPATSSWAPTASPAVRVADAMLDHGLV